MSEKRNDGTQNSLRDKISLWTGVLSLAGILIASFLYLISPGLANNTAIQLQEQRITAQAETIATLTKTQQNDTQEVKGNLTALTNKVNEQNVSIEKLITIIDERIPKD